LGVFELRDPNAYYAGGVSVCCLVCKLSLVAYSVSMLTALCPASSMFPSGSFEVLLLAVFRKLVFKN